MTGKDNIQEKPREFWVHPGDEKGKSFVCEAGETRRSEGVHVIEKSAYESLERQNRDLVEALKFYGFGNLDKRKPVEFTRPEDAGYNDPEVGLFIDWSDVSSSGLPKEYIMQTTGKKAREVLAEIEGLN